jgi:uncharacterized protein YbjT (DUF2867 family)
MSNEKVIAVIGATGSHGGALSNSILSDRSKGKFRCRAITRDPTKKYALALKSAGAEVVRADLDDVGNPPAHSVTAARSSLLSAR